MRTFIVCAFVVMGSFFGMYPCWAAPEPASPATSVYAETIARIRARDAITADVNGYPALARELSRAATAAEIEAIEPLKQYDVGYRKGVLAALAAHPKEAAAAVKAFEDKVLPRLRLAFHQPNFVYPSHWEEWPAGLVPNFVRLRTLAEEIQTVGYFEEQRGNLAAAAEAYELCMAEGTRLSKQGPLIDFMVGVAIENIGTRPMLTLLSGPAPDRPVLEQTQVELNALPVDPADFGRAMDEELVFGEKTMDRIVGDASGEMARTAQIPDTSSQELSLQRKFYEHFVMSRRADWYALRSSPDFDIASLANEPHGQFASWVSPSSSRAVLQTCLSLTQVSAVRLVCAIRLYRARHGTWPASLESVKPLLRSDVPRDYMNCDGRFTYDPATGHLTSISKDYARLNPKSGDRISYFPWREE